MKKAKKGMMGPMIMAAAMDKKAAPKKAMAAKMKNKKKK